MPAKKIDFEKQKKDKLLRANIAHNMEIYGVKRKQDIADRLRISRQSLQRRKRIGGDDKWIKVLSFRCDYRQNSMKI